MRFRRKRHTYITPSPEYTERLDRLQFMAGQVGLYSRPTCTHQRPDSKRPQALKSRVVRAKRRGSRTAVALKRRGVGLHARNGEEPALRLREAEWLLAQPVINMASPKEKKR